MSRLFVPPAVARELIEQRRHREAEALKALSDEHQWRWVQQFNHELARVDRRLKLLWCPDPAPVEAVAAGALPGRWNVVRMNELGDAPMSVIPLVDDEGGFREPGSWVFKMLADNDLWDPAVGRERKRKRDELRRAREERQTREREERQEELRDRVKAIRDVRISFNRDAPWTQNVAGKRGAPRSGRPDS